MLEQLFGSQTRVKLLQIFLNNPGEKYFVRELTRILGSQINAIRRELENLHTLDIICQIENIADENGKMARQKFYQSNHKFVLYPELKSIIEKSQFLLNKKFANSLKKAGKVHYLALTGRFVGDGNVPTDIIIVGKLKKKSVERIIKNFEKTIAREINFTIFDKEEFNYRRSVADRFLYSILDSEKIVMIDDIMNTLAEVTNEVGDEEK
jgi:predicted transcriptional regulator